MEGIKKVNKRLPPNYQLEEVGKEIHLYMYGQSKEDKNGKKIPVKHLANNLHTGTKRERAAFIDGMLALVDIADNFLDFAKRLEGVQNGRPTGPVEKQD